MGAELGPGSYNSPVSGLRFKLLYDPSSACTAIPCVLLRSVMACVSTVGRTGALVPASLLVAKVGSRTALVPDPCPAGVILPSGVRTCCALGGRTELALSSLAVAPVDTISPALAAGRTPFVAMV